MSKRPTEPDDWSAQSEALFDSARGAHAPTAADRERVRSALAQKLAAASGAPATLSDAQARLAGSGMSRAALGKLAKIGFGAACVLVGAAAFMRAGDSRERPRAKSIAAQTNPSAAKPAQRAAEPAVAVGDPAATSSVAPASAAGARSLGAMPARPAARRSAVLPTPVKVSVSGPAPEHSHPRAIEQAASVGTQSPSSPRPDAPAEGAENTTDARAELEFVARINAAVRESTPQTVLALCAEHERRWPHGIFEQEREGTRAIASCNAKSPGVGARAQAFLASYPRAAIAARVREECAPLLTAATRSQGRE